MIKKNILIDYENVANDLFAPMIRAAAFAGSNVRVYVFYSKNRGFDKREWNARYPKLKIIPIFCEFVKAKSNNLDFQLTATMGELINKSKKDQFFIVSSDKGFCPLGSFYKKKGIKVFTIGADTLRNILLSSTTKRQWKKYIKGQGD